MLKIVRCWVIVILQSLIGFLYVFEADIILLPLLNDAKISRKKFKSSNLAEIRTWYSPLFQSSSISGVLSSSHTMQRL